MLCYVDTRISASDKITFVPRINGQRVYPFDLYPTLRVARVTDSEGRDLNFIQENKDKDADLSIIFPEAPTPGTPVVLNFEYEGEGVVLNRGSGNFILNPARVQAGIPTTGALNLGDRGCLRDQFSISKKHDDDRGWRASRDGSS
jgi:hypothetical protein